MSTHTLTLEMFNDLKIVNKNDVQLAVLWLIHEQNIKRFSDDFLEFIRSNYYEYLFDDILLLVPDDRLELKKQIIDSFETLGSKQLKSIFVFMKNDVDFIKYVIEKQQKHSNA